MIYKKLIMCGISGIIRYNSPVDETEIKSMTKSIAHRGPDGEGVFIKDNIALGHRRLSIIDLDGGKQPMSYNNGNLHITYNGEIYNYIELKKELKALGHKFKTNSDTEVILASYSEWKEKCLNKLRGMFAFCIHDIEENKLFISRDPLGIKPLYYSINSEYFGFASELCALKQIENFDETINLKSIEEFLRLSYIPDPNSIYKNTFKLPPGASLNFDLKNNTYTIQKYFSFNFQSENSKDIDWVKQTKNYLQESVKAHLVSDVPFGVFLSGGIDSTLIAGIMSKTLDQKVKAFAIGFCNKQYDELKYAEKAAKRYGIELITKKIDSNELSIIENLLYHYGEPFGDSSAIPTWHVSKLARKYVPMVLSGDGGDELFGGYLSHQNWVNNSPHNFIIKQYKNRGIIAGTRAKIGYYRKYINNKSSYNFLDEWLPKFEYSDKRTRNELWKKDYHYLISEPIQKFDESHLKALHSNRLNYAQFMDINTNLPGHILSKVDIASMCHGLEIRPPIIDIEVLKLACKIPINEKFDSQSDSPGKYNLKRLLIQDFDHEFIYRKKQGFSIPKNEWFFKGKSGYNHIMDFINNKNLLTDVFNINYIEELLKKHNSKEKDNSNTLWLLLVLVLWFNQNPKAQL